MKRLMLVTALTLAGTPALSETQLTGTWQTATYSGDYAHVRFGPCQGKICGVVTKTFGPDGEIQGGSLGKTIVVDMEPAGGGSYEGGRIRRPDTGQSAPLKLQVQGASMQVSACIGPLCRNETWQKVQ